MKWYIKAFECNARVEPLLKIVEHYKDNNWTLAYTFAHLACSLEYPFDCILFIDGHAYDYKRWHLLGIIAWYAGHYDEGKDACTKAIQAGMNVTLDSNNLKHYLIREKNNLKSPETLRVIENKQNENTEGNKPSTLQDNKPSTLQDNKPSTLQDNKPSTLQETHKQKLMTKKDFLEIKKSELRIINPNMTDTQLTKIALNMWKCRNS
jgi:hypothetical protein